MKCPRCNSEVDRKWRYCPKCGAMLGMNLFSDSFFSSMFSRMRKEMGDMDKLFERDIEAFDLSPFFKKPNRTGFSIRITQSTGKEPKVSIKTFGDVDRERVRRQLENQLGLKKSYRPEIFERKKVPKPVGYEEKPAEPEKSLPTPKFTEEPKTNVRRVDSKVLVELEVPGVKSVEDIEVKELENSVEIKALAGEKAFFKILTKPQQFRLTGRSFENGILRLEFS